METQFSAVRLFVEVTFSRDLAHAAYTHRLRCSINLSVCQSLSGVETTVGLGADCYQRVGSRKIGWGRVGSFKKIAQRRGGRLGGARKGWQANIAWQRAIGQEIFFCSTPHAELNDESGFSDLFKNGAKRRESLNSAILSYSIPLQKVANGLHSPY